MIKFASITNDKLKTCMVGTGTDAEFYKSIGMVEMDVEQGKDGQWYLKGFAPTHPLDELKSQKLNELNTEHEKAETEAYVISSLGFTVDANDRANRDIDGIIKTIGEGTVMFCDYENNFHELNRAQCETLQVEIIQNAQSLYAQKWAYRAQVEGAESVDELNAIEFTFTHLSF